MKKGFTLVEILVVIAIISVLSIIAIPNFIESLNTASVGAMKTQENELVDAAKLFIEDYCRNPVGDTAGQCNNYSHNIKSTSITSKYTCLNELKLIKYIDDITFKGNKCYGFVVYEKEANSKKYSNFSAYLQCGDAYQTSGIGNIKDQSGNLILSKCQ